MTFSERDSIVDDVRRWTQDSQQIVRDQRKMGCWVISPATIAFVVVTFWLLVTGVRADTYQGRTIAFAIAGVCGLMSIRLGAIDRATRLSLATSPEGAAHLFVSCIRHGRYNRALALVIPDRRETENPVVPRFESISTATPPEWFRSDFGFKRYLECFWVSGNGRTRKSRLLEIKIIPEEENVVIVDANVGIRSYSDHVLLGLFINIFAVFILANVMSEKEVVTWRKRLIKGENGLWYFCNAAWHGPGDPIV